jgi:predicted secreted protein
MAAGTGFLGYGSVLKKGSTVIGEITGISGPSLSTDAVDITHMESPSGIREFVAGLVDLGEVTCELNMEAAGTSIATLVTDAKARTITEYTILVVGSAASTFVFQAFINALEFGIPIDDKATASVGLKLTSTLTFTA